MWFKVDDGFDSHPKVLRAGNAAIGLWTRCGAYCSRMLTDGFVPGEIARMYGTRKEIAALIAARLWLEADGGYTMHDFDDYNPLAEQVMARRESDAERQRRGREAQKSRRDSQRDGPSDSQRDSGRDTRRESNGGPHGGPDPKKNCAFNPLLDPSELFLAAANEDDQIEPWRKP